MFRKSTVLYFLIALSVSATAIMAQEHPTEHPADAPADKANTAPKVSIEAMATAIKGYVDGDSKLKGGFFMMYDNKSKKPLALKLTDVHEERLAKVGNNLYFACSDFDGPGGEAFDLDFFMEEVDGTLQVTQVLIHKEDGNPRYTWFEENGLWKTKPVASK